MDPLVVSLTLEPGGQARFDELRRAHFPPERLLVDAHLTLFHALPGEQRTTVGADLDAAAAAWGPFAVAVTGLRLLGRGVAYAMAAPELDAVHAALAARWRPWLTAQDRQPFRAHVTVQNKVAPDVARATFDRLAAEPVPAEVRALGLDLWRYAGGPWDHLGHHAFRCEPVPAGR